MKQSRKGKNSKAVNVGKVSEIIEHELPMGLDFVLKGKVFAGQTVGATGSELSFQTLVPSQDSGFLHTHKTHEELYITAWRGHLSGGWRVVPHQRRYYRPRFTQRQACAEEYRQR